MFGIEIGRERHQVDDFFSPVTLPDVSKKHPVINVNSYTDRHALIPFIMNVLVSRFLSVKRALACNEGGASGLRFSTRTLVL